MGNIMNQSIAKNTAFMTFASIAQKIISFVYFTLIARSLGVEGTGKYFLALSFTTIFVVFVDLGMTNVLVRESAKVRQNIQKYLSTVLSVKLLFGIFSYCGVFILSSFLYSDRELEHLIWLSGVTMLFDSFNLSVYGVLRALGDLRFESISITLSQFFSFVLGSVFLFFHLPLIFLILAFTIPSAINSIFSAVIVFKKYRVKPFPAFDKATFIFLWKITIPFALAAIFARVYSYIDTILLKQFLGDSAVGFYSTPYKITFAFQFIPLALIAALYPRFSEYFVHQKEKLSTIFQDSLKYLLILSVPIAFGIAVLAEDILVFLYTEEFLPSVLPLQILILSLIFSFLSFPLGALLNACNKQATQTKIVGLVMLFNIGLNLILIPLFGVTGAALSAFAGNALLAIVGYAFVGSVLRVDQNRMLKNLFRVFLSGGIMTITVWFTNFFVHFILSIFCGAFIYIGMLFLSKALSIAEVQEAFRMLKK